MAKMHKLVDLGPQVPREPCMWKKLHMFLEQYPAEDEFPDNKRFCLHLTPGNFDPQPLKCRKMWNFMVFEV